MDQTFPGRYIGGVSMALAPPLLLTGVLLRIQFHFFFPQQLEAYAAHPALMTASLNCFVAGNIALWPAIVTLAQRIGEKRPLWALWGGSFTLFGLFARTFHGGADHMAYQMDRILGVQTATSIVAASYGAFHIVSALSGIILFGWILLAIGAWLSRTLGLIRSIALGLMSALMLGILKGSSATSIVATAGLCIALVPLGIQTLIAPPRPRTRTALAWSAVVIAVAIALFVLGQLG
jgi:hypothetical protein